MAERLNQFYNDAQELGGLKAKIRLAVITRTPSSKAAELEDSIELTSIFRDALEEIKKEFK